MLFDNDNSIFAFTNNNDLNIYTNILKHNNSTSKILQPNEALTLGNAFESLYKPYKNYKVAIIRPKNEKEADLLKIQELDFIISELNLYLDIHPYDKDTYELFKKYTKEFKNYLDKYENNYGSLLLIDDNYKNYNWVKSSWPWDKGGSY